MVATHKMFTETPLNKLRIEGNKIYLDDLELGRVMEYEVKRFNEDMLELKVALLVQG